MIQFIPVTYFKEVEVMSSIKFDMKRDAKKIRLYIESCFFDFGINTLVVKMNNEMYILEPDTTVDAGYTRTKIEYHPYMNLFE